MIKIVHVLTDTNIGGAGIWLLNFLKGTDKTKYSVSVILPTGAMLSPKVKELGADVFELSSICDVSFSKKAIKEIKELLFKIKPDIVHTHASISARIAAKMLKIKTVNTRHCLEEKKSFPKSIVYAFINNFLSDRVIGVSQAVCENLLNDGTKKEKIKLLYNAIEPVLKISDEEKNRLKQEMKIPQNDIVIGIVARLEDVKNHMLFLDAAKLILLENENVTFLVIGDGTLKNELINRAKLLGISEKVIFTGYRNDARNLMNIMDINTLTSKREALSISLIEGMSLGLASVTTDSGGVSEVVIDGVNGFVCENGNVQAFKDALKTLINDKEKREEMGKLGEKRAREIFGMKTMMDEISKIYSQMLNREDGKNL